MDTAQAIRDKLGEQGISRGDSPCVATGYGRVAVPYADKTVTEITCHAKGSLWIYGIEDGVVIDIGGQDTKAIRVENSMVKDFVMNDK